MFDVAILGGGPAGYTAAERAGACGMNVVLFEKSALGGCCLNEGCIPTKTLLYSSKLYYNALNGKKYGINVETASFEYDKIVGRKNKVVRKLVAGIKAKMTHNNVTVIAGDAEVVSNEGGVVTIKSGDEKYQAGKLLICTGSVVAIPPIKGVDTASYWTSKEALEAKEVPESLVIIGGGVIGMEFAGLFSTFGTKVTVIEMAPEILPGIDTEISSMLRAEMGKKGVEFHLSSKVLEVHTGKVLYADGEGTEHTIESAEILLCVGRRPNKQGIEALSLEPFRNGVKVDETMKTSVDNVWAAGDITAFSLLAHTAVREAEVAVNNMLGKVDTMSYKAIPGVIYTNPEVAGVGVTEDVAKEQGIEHSIKKLAMTYSGRFVAENEGGNGICKLVVDTNDIIIGAHMIGNPSSELISSAVIAIETGMTVEMLKKIVFPHPSVSEIFKETLFEG